MKRFLLAFLVLLNLISFIAFAAGLIVAVTPVLAHSDVEVTLSLVLLGIGITAPALTAGVLFKTELISSGSTWKEIADDLRPLLSRGGS